MQPFAQVVVYVCLFGLAAGIFNTEEDGGLYELYWSFDNEAETIAFA